MSKEMAIGNLTFTCNAEKCPRQFTCISPEYNPVIGQSICPYLGAYAQSHPFFIKSESTELGYNICEFRNRRMEERMANILTILRNEPLNSLELADRIGINSTGVKRMVGILKDRGYNIIHNREQKGHRKHYYELIE